MWERCASILGNNERTGKWRPKGPAPKTLTVLWELQLRGTQRGCWEVLHCSGWMMGRMGDAGFSFCQGTLI